MSEQLDRRLFLMGLMLTSSGLIIPKPSLFALSAWEEEDVWAAQGLDHIVLLNCDQNEGSVASDWVLVGGGGGDPFQYF